MPYFHNDKINLLFIHIPKTGGTSLENYFSKKYNIPLNEKSLYTIDDLVFTDEYINKYNHISYQHLSIMTIIKNSADLKINFNSLNCITIVRNPYTRIISDLFFLKLINKNSTPDEVFSIIKNNYLSNNENRYDGHYLPQYSYIIDKTKKIIKNIKIMKNEYLNDTMKMLGYNDFDNHSHKGNVSNDTYLSYLNNESIAIINDYYHKDFILFKYLKIKPTPVNSTPINSTPINSTPVNSTPINSTPVNSTPVKPTPVNSTPVNSTPVNSTPVKPRPVNSTPVKPTPINSTPVNSTPVNSTPIKPSPTKPTPIKPTPIKPTPIKPTPTKPTHIQQSSVQQSNNIKVIPLNLYTCWHTLDLPPLMKKNYTLLMDTNPEFNHFLFDENDCQTFISNHFNKNVLNAYITIIPSAYKSDLWRYCILYIYGGIYLDIKYKCINGFKFINLTDKEYFVDDIEESGSGTYNGLIICKPKNEIMLKCINQIVENVNNKYYGKSSLATTGSLLLSNYSTIEDKNKFELKLQLIDNCGYIVYKDKNILKHYSEYRIEQEKYKKNKKYSILWNKKNIYNIPTKN